MAEDTDLNVIISATYAQYQEAMGQVSAQTEATAASVKASLDGMGASMGAVDAAVQPLRQAQIIYGRASAAVDEFTAAIQEQAAALPILTAEEEQARQAIVSLGMAQTFNAFVAEEDAKALEEEAAATENLGGAAGQSGERVSYMTRYIERFGVRMAIVLAAYEAFRLLKGAISDGADELQRMSAISLDLATFGKGAAEAGTKAYDFAEDMAHLGVASKDSLGALQAMINASGHDLPDALNSAKLALDMAASKEIPLSEASKLVAGLLAGKPGSIAAASQLLGKDLKTAQDALDALRDHFGGDTEAMASMAHTQEGFWHDMGRAIAATWQQVIHHDFRGEFLVQRRDLEREQEIIKANISAAQAAKAPYDYWTRALKENEASIVRVDDQLRSLNAEALKGADAARAAAKAQYGVPTPGKAPPPPPGTPDASAIQQALNLQAETVQRLQEAYRGLSEEELHEADTALRGATDAQQVTAAETQAITQRKQLMADEIQTVMADQQKELANSKLTAQEREQIQETAQVKIETIQRKGSADIRAIQQDASNKLDGILEAQFSKEYSEAQKGSEKRVQLAQKEAAKMGEIFGLESKEYIKAEKVEEQATKEHEDQILKSKLNTINVTEQANAKALGSARRDIEEEYQAHQISLSKEVALLKQNAAEEYAIEKDALLKKLQLLQLEGVDTSKEQAQLLALDKKYQSQLTQIDTTAEKQRMQSFRTWITTVSRSFSSAITSMIEGTKTWQQAWADVLKSMLSSFIDAITQMLMEQLASDLIAALSSKKAAASKVSDNISVAATGAAGSAAAIPYVGWIIALGAAAAIVAGLAAYKASGGYDVPGYASPVTQLHPREMVLPAELADTVRGAVGAGGNQGGGSMTVNVQAFDSQDVARFFRRNSSALARSLHGLTARNSPALRSFS